MSLPSAATVGICGIWIQIQIARKKWAQYNRPMAKYRALFERYRALIASGAYAPGERLPSLREAAGQAGVALNTARAAFDLLESEGLARPTERGGYYVRGPARRLSAPSSPKACREASGLDAQQKIEYLLEAGGASGGFALAEPDSLLLPSSRLERLYASLPGHWIDYGDQSGEEELKRRIAAAYFVPNGGLDPADIIVTNGATEAIGIALRALLEPGDAVAVESPTYYDYFRQLGAVRARIVEVPLRPGQGMDLDLLEARLRRGGIKMVLAQPNVQNPTGSIMSDGDKRSLVGLAERYGAALVQDDVYGDLAFSEARPANLGAFGGYDRLVHISSFSKVLAPGLRIGWMSAGSLRPALARAKGMASLMTNRPAQAVLAAYLAGSAFRKQLCRMRAELERQLAEYLELLCEALPEGSSLAPPSGGCLLWVALPKGSDASRLFESAAREGILIAPGELFSANPFFRGCLRINFGYRLTESRRAALLRLCALARSSKQV
jgi:DNA-binding transcriptional MocR family regulator